MMGDPASFAIDHRIHHQVIPQVIRGEKWAIKCPFWSNLCMLAIPIPIPITSSWWHLLYRWNVKYHSDRPSISDIPGQALSMSYDSSTMFVG